MKINGYEIALSEEKLDDIINNQTLPIELIDKDFSGYKELSEGDKKALQYRRDLPACWQTCTCGRQSLLP